MAETPKSAPGARPMHRTAAPAPAEAKPAPVAAKPAPVAAASENKTAPAAGAKDEPTHGIRQIRVRGKLADGREFVSAGTFLLPVDPNASAKK